LAERVATIYDENVVELRSRLQGMLARSAADVDVVSLAVRLTALSTRRQLVEAGRAIALLSTLETVQPVELVHSAHLLVDRVHPHPQATLTRIRDSLGEDADRLEKTVDGGDHEPRAFRTGFDQIDEMIGGLA